jgi:hypothetical protein
MLDLLILKLLVLQNLPWLYQKQDCQNPNAFMGRLLIVDPSFDYKLQHLMYILQNQNDCPHRPSPLNNLYHKNKETTHANTRIFLKKELLYIFANKILN